METRKRTQIRKLIEWISTHRVLSVLLFWAGFGTFYYFNRALRLDLPDFKVFYTAGIHALHSPLDLYSKSPDIYLYPPPSALFFAPFATLPWEWARAIWYASIVAICFLLSSSSWVTFFSFLAIFRYALINLHYGQVNILVLFAMWMAHRLSSQNKESKAGAFLATASILKLFPLVQIVGALLDRRWSLLTRSLAWIIGISLLPLLFWTPDEVFKLWIEFPGQIFGKKGVPNYSHNQSFTALLLRLFSGEPFIMLTGGYVHWPLAQIERKFLFAGGLALGTLTSLYCWVIALKRRLPGDLLTAACFTVIFFPHLVWKAYFIFLFPAFIQIIQKRAWSPVLILALGFEFFTGPDLLGFRLSGLLDGANIHLLVALMVAWCWSRLPSDQPERCEKSVPISSSISS